MTSENNRPTKTVWHTNQEREDRSTDYLAIEVYDAGDVKIVNQKDGAVLGSVSAYQVDAWQAAFAHAVSRKLASREEWQ